MMAPSPAAVECVIRAEPDHHFLRLEAIVRSGAPVSGRYHFIIEKHSSIGRTNNIQSGQFTLTESSEQVLSRLVLDRSAVGHYRAELSLQSDAGDFTCSSP